MRGSTHLSVAAAILPQRLLVRDALLKMPENREMPIAAELTLADPDGTPITASFDFAHTAPRIWEIAVDTDTGRMLLSQAGDRLQVGGQDVPLGPPAEYPTLYARFAELIAARRSDVDATPLELVADAFLLGRREPAPAFVDPLATVAPADLSEYMLR